MSILSIGQARPEFFRGVATIVNKLFNIVQPSTAYFGQKDISQCILISRMVHDLNIPVKIRVCETIRENDGLAMSSRNTYLTLDERPKANVLYHALSAGKELCEKRLNLMSAGSRNGIDGVPREQVIQAIHNILKSQPAVTKVEYISVGTLCYYDSHVPFCMIYLHDGSPSDLIYHPLVD